MKTGLVIMTALVPTIGHQYLVEFAANFMASLGGELDVIVFDRQHEPVPGALRKESFIEQFADHGHVHFYDVRDDDAPQNDDGTQEFWNYWMEMVSDTTRIGQYQYIFASEAYGKTFADQYKAEFIPCDIDREVIEVKGTNVRNDIVANWQQIMPAFRARLTQRITFFGAESTGKTTMAKRFAKDPNYGGVFVHEWARPYLERFGPEVTSKRMENITHAQFSAQISALRNPQCGPFLYQDTDLLSTIGYYRIYGGESYYDIQKMFKVTKSHLYIVMNSKIPFTPDPLRYGGEVRESSDQFWIDLLEENKCNYYVVQAVDPEEQYMEIAMELDRLAHDSWYDIASFVRD